MFTGYELTPPSRKLLLEAFLPRYGTVMAHHVTERYGVRPEAAAPAQPVSVRIFGRFDSGDGVEGLRVIVDSRTLRSDGEPYHLTLSLGPNKKPMAAGRYVHTAIDVPPFEIQVVAKNFCRAGGRR